MPVLWLCGHDDAYVREALPHLEALGVRADRLSLADLATRFPQVDTADVESAYLEYGAAALFARRACRAVVAAFIREGGTYRVAGAESPCIDGGSLQQIDLSDGSVLEAEAFVFACGPWLRTLFPNELEPLLRVSRQEVHFFGTPAHDTSFDAGTLPIWVDIGAGYYGLPALDGRGFKLAADRRGEDFDPTRGDRQATPSGIEAARSFLSKRFPRLSDAPLLESRVCQYTNTPDDHLLIDTHPQADNLWLVGGGSGHGFKLGPAVGEKVAAYLLDGAQPEACFRLDRRGRRGRRGPRGRQDGQEPKGRSPRWG